jgi:hypothetical protein
MVEFVSWAFVAVIGVFALVGFLGVVATSVVTVVRALRREAAQQPTESRERIASAA